MLFFSCILLANSADYCVNHSIVCKMNLSPSLGETMPVIKMWTCRDYVQYFHFGDYKARNVPHMLPHGGLWRRKKHLLLVLDECLFWTLAVNVSLYWSINIFLRMHNYSVDRLYGHNVNWFRGLSYLFLLRTVGWAQIIRCCNIQCY